MPNATEPKGNIPNHPSVPDLALLRRIGNGSYGEVWLARNLVGSYRAVKVLWNCPKDPMDAAQREFIGVTHFEPWCRSHQGLVDILHVGRSPDGRFFYYVMELADDLHSDGDIDPDHYSCRSLGAWVQKRGVLNLREVVSIGLVLAEALEHLHTQGLIHRDIKPSNILFIRGVPKLADIGLVTRAAEHCTVVGTPGFMAPEGSGLVPADVYSLGRVLHFCRTGAHHAPTPADEERTQVLPEGEANGLLLEVLRRCCERDVAMRFKTARELQLALRAVEELTRALDRPAAAGAATQVPPPVRPRKVSIAYKSKAQPDGKLLELVADALRRRGHHVFIDRHLSIGVQWAQEIESNLKSSDAVLVLLSPASVQSEMVAHELEFAWHCWQSQGTPVLLPVRVAFNGPLPEPFGRILNPLSQFFWKNAEENASLIEAIIHAVESPPQGPLGQRQPRVEGVGGAVPLNSKFYVSRPADEEFRSAILRQDSIVLVKGARQMGKTSLLARGLQEARTSGARVVMTDFQSLNASDLGSIERFYQAVAQSIAADLDLPDGPISNWSSTQAPNVNFQRFIQREVLGRLSTPLVWGLDEVDRLFTTTFGSEVFGLFRTWHNKRSLDPAGPWSRFTLAIAYATEAHLFITDVNQSPFNVGTRVSLDDFAEEHVADLNARHGRPLRSDSEFNAFMKLVSGHPFLVRRALKEMVDRQISFSDLAGSAARDEGIFGDHLRRLLVTLARSSELLKEVRCILSGEGCSTTEGFLRLRSAGVVSGVEARDARLRCKLYEQYLTPHLLK